MRVPPLRGLALAGLALAWTATGGTAQREALDPADAARPTLAEMQTLLESLDRAFNARDLPGYLDLFRANNHEAQRVLTGWLQPLLGGAVPLERASTIRGDDLDFGDQTAVLVTSTFRAAARTDGPEFQAHHYLVGRRFQGQLRASLQVEVDRGHLRAVRDATFRCPPCNYRMGGGRDWLVTPVGRDRARCMEAVLFYLVGADVTTELSVHLADMAEPVEKTFAALRQDLAQWRPALEFDRPEAWLPPAHRERRAGFTGSRATGRDAEGAVELYLVVRGAMRFAICVRGPAQALARHRASIDELLATFRLLQPDLQPEDMVAQASRMHTGGGQFDDKGYTNERWGVALDLPCDWSQLVRPGPHLFRLTLYSPERDSRMWVTAYAPGAGSDRWLPAAAERMARDHLQRLGVADPAGAGWRRGQGGFEVASWPLPLPPSTHPEGAPAAAGAQRTLWVFLRDDLLLMIDGLAADPTAADTIEQSALSVRRER